jgi:hypothetical protein
MTITEEDFESKKHITKHLTLGRFGKTEEATRVNSWAEQDYLSFKLFLARTLTPENVTPTTLKTICDASIKYTKAYKSYKFGVIAGVKPKWVVVAVIAVVAVFLLMYFSGMLGVR